MSTCLTWTPSLCSTRPRRASQTHLRVRAACGLLLHAAAAVFLGLARVVVGLTPAGFAHAGKLSALRLSADAAITVLRVDQVRALAGVLPLPHDSLPLRRSSCRSRRAARSRRPPRPRTRMIERGALRERCYAGSSR